MQSQKHHLKLHGNCSWNAIKNALRIFPQSINFDARALEVRWTSV
ncbi:hypothetical protein BRYFOR_06074 [Marvinbryantia formatexigens DSM 14469]|uniref:Uncharacterized protein n=1 Tax=Marvinbryantia formatexigens DSM 14469 TaxID=478749 RepID=C6LBS9_9FIRM|nr:hypothetical protein BRYFOR_06074 [Marvinbryantia formatexigens DSM 14469]